jgi:isopenicillin-N epimerase
VNATAPNSLREQFLLDPDVVFLNHGSYGACPKPVFEVYQALQRELERQPVEFLGRRSDALLDEARARLGDYVNAAPDDLDFVPNATSGLNVVARSLALQPGDEILTTDLEYGALDMTWRHVCTKTGAAYVHQPIPFPVSTAEETFVESFWSGVTSRTRVIFLANHFGHRALILPVAAIARRARAARHHDDSRRRARTRSHSARPSGARRRRLRR